MYDIVLVVDTGNKEKIKGTVDSYLNIIMLQLIMANNILINTQVLSIVIKIVVTIKFNGDAILSGWRVTLRRVKSTT